MTRNKLARLLEGAGYTVTRAANGQEALAQVTTDSVDVVLTDLAMPQLDGFGVLRHVQQVAPHIPVILMTAYATPETEQQAYQLGAQAVVAKPLDLNALLERIARTLTP